MGGYEKKWLKGKAIGKGGQGTVYDCQQVNEDLELAEIVLGKTVIELAEAAKYSTNIEKQRKLGLKILSSIENHIWREKFALKLLNDAKDAKNPKTAAKRMTLEIVAMSKVDHPNLLSLVDHGDDWYVTKFLPNGTLEDQPERFKGDLYGAVKWLMPLFRGVLHIHQNEFVHRDIKPGNIFIDGNDQPVLGDFGLAFSTVQNRQSATLENIGTRNWMPPWAEDRKLEDIPKAFDVFSLSKLIWCLVAGQPSLKFDYFDQDHCNLESMFPDKPEMKIANQLFEQTITMRLPEMKMKHIKAFIKFVDLEIIKRREVASIRIEDLWTICDECSGRRFSNESDSNNWGPCLGCEGEGGKPTSLGSVMVQFQKQFENSQTELNGPPAGIGSKFQST